MTESSGSGSRGGGGLADALRRYVDAVAGITEVPRERAEKIVSDLAERGELRARDIQKAARDLADRSNRNREELVRLVQKEIRRQVSGLGLPTREDIDRLQRRIRRLEEEKQEQPSPGKAKSASSGSSKKKPARKRKPAARKPRASGG